MRNVFIIALLSALGLAAGCQQEASEPDTVVVEKEAADDDGDSFSLEIDGESDSVSISAEDDDDGK